MIDDLVYRLRGQRTNGRLCEQAAEEIIKLQEERDYWRQIASGLALSIYITLDPYNRPYRIENALKAYKDAKDRKDDCV